MSLVRHYKQLRESIDDSRFEIPGSYNPVSITAGSDFLARVFGMEIVYKISVSIFEGVRADICENPPPAHDM